MNSHKFFSYPINMSLAEFYLHPALNSFDHKSKLASIRRNCDHVIDIETEFCFYVQHSLNSGNAFKLLRWLLGNVEESSYFDASSVVIEIGPRLNVSTPYSTNAVSICRAVGLHVDRVERSLRYRLIVERPLSEAQLNTISDVLCDRMTERRYYTTLVTLSTPHEVEPWYYVDVDKQGLAALEKVNRHLGLALDPTDLNYYLHLFRNVLHRNPTSVECFDLAQSNSEHSRHWFFKGKLIIDDHLLDQSLFSMLISTQATSNPNNVIKFSDNSSAIEGYTAQFLTVSRAGVASAYEKLCMKRHLTLTAETHNFPTAVSPFSGAATGTGGRIRDNQAVGRGGHVMAATVGYSFGNLLIAGYDLPWENEWEYPIGLARPLDVIIGASNGASDYGNKFGEPVVAGWARSFGQIVHNHRREWVKPIMFSAGIGQVDDALTKKMKPSKGMKVVKIGGPAYRIGMGGGAASSQPVQGGESSTLEFDAVQRGDAQMEQKLNRLLRACIESGIRNPICSIHDQGAGGNGNVLKEIVSPEGAVIYTKCFELGDPSLSTMELWGAEYQESNAILCHAEDVPRLTEMAARERCPISVVGHVTGTGRVVLSESTEEQAENGPYPVDLPLSAVLEEVPQKTFNLRRQQTTLIPLELDTVDVQSAVERVLRLPSVASKRYLTSKVDRSVTGLVAQQQCVGPIHTPLADVAVVAMSYFDTVGTATAIGEQPIKGLVDPAAGARMSLAEALTNLMWAPISQLRDVKCSCNWMWPAKLPGEDAALVDACSALCQSMIQLGVAVDGGKDSLSMAARAGSAMIKAPSTVVLSAYAPCPDVRQVVTPDLKCQNDEDSILFLVDLSAGKCRLGGSSLAQCYNQIGDSVPDLDDPLLLAKAFNCLNPDGVILAGHDISDGGFIVCLLEMTFAGVCGVRVDIPSASGVRRGRPLAVLFSEELGWIIQVSRRHQCDVAQYYTDAGVTCIAVGFTTTQGPHQLIDVKIDGETVIQGNRSDFMRMWEETSYRLDLLQADTDCVRQEFDDVAIRTGPNHLVTFDPDAPVQYTEEVGIPRNPRDVPRLAILREEGTNGDREMAAAFFSAGFQVWDVNTVDLINAKVDVNDFKGLVFCGGFSFADVLGPAKGWAASLLWRQSLRDQLATFRQRKDTFSLGVCNGCQLMARLGWLDPAPRQLDALDAPVISLEHNRSARYESRFVTVGFEPTNAVLLRGMAGSRLGVWVAHQEGRFAINDVEVLESLRRHRCIALRYVDDNGQPSMIYPMNPNGSVDAIAAISSPDGRHLGMMPHPERSFMKWQLPWQAPSLARYVQSPWKKMFDNAFEWSLSN